MKQQKRAESVKPRTAPVRQAWEPMKLTYVAHVRDIAMPGILKGGSVSEGGPFKVSGQFG
jgi:hypothetical protein